MKRTRAWSKEGSPAVVTVSNTRAITISTLNAISASGLIKVRLRVPRRNNKRKTGQESEGLNTGAVTIVLSAL